MSPVVVMCVALASKVITLHGYLTGLTMAQVLDQVAICSLFSLLITSLTLYQRVSKYT